MRAYHHVQSCTLTRVISLNGQHQPGLGHAFLGLSRFRANVHVLIAVKSVFTRFR